MKNESSRDTERGDTSKYENRARRDSIETRGTYEPVRSMTALRAEIVRIDKIDSISMKNSMDRAYANMDIESALHWEKQYNDYRSRLCDAVDSRLAAEVLRGCISHNHYWKGPIWLRIIRSTKLKENVPWLKALGKSKWQRAVWDLSKVIDYDPNMDYAYNLRAIAYTELGRFDMALQDFDRAINMKPKEPGYYINRGLCYSIKDDDDSALRDYDAAISLDPEIAEAYCNRGVIHVSREDFKLALFDFSRAVALDPGHARHYSNRGNVYSELGQKDLAIVDYNTAIRINPKNAEVYAKRGLTFYDMEEFKLTVRDLSRAIKLGRPSANIYLKRAAAYKALGKYAEADQDTIWALEKEGKGYKG